MYEDFLNGFEREETFYSVNLVRQFENASVVHFNRHKNITGERNELNQPEPSHFELSIQAEEGQYEFVFKEYQWPLKKGQTFEFIL